MTPYCCSNQKLSLATPLIEFLSLSLIALFGDTPYVATAFMCSTRRTKTQLEAVTLTKNPANLNILCSVNSGKDTDV